MKSGKRRIDWSVFQKRWPYFLAFLAVNCVLCVYAAYAINDPKDTEVFYLFVGAYDCDASAVKERTSKTEGFPELRRFYVKDASLSSATFDTQLSTYGLVHSDLLILPLSELDAMPAYSAMCASFSVDYANEKFGSGLTYLTSGDECYGIKVYDAAAKKGLFDDVISYTAVDKTPEDYYLIFKTTSIHLGDMEDGTKTDYAITIAQGLLKL